MSHPRITSVLCEHVIYEYWYCGQPCNPLAMGRVKAMRAPTLRLIASPMNVSAGLRARSRDSRAASRGRSPHSRVPIEPRGCYQRHRSNSWKMGVSRGSRLGAQGGRGMIDEANHATAPPVFVQSSLRIPRRPACQHKPTQQLRRWCK